MVSDLQRFPIRKLPNAARTSSPIRHSDAIFDVAALLGFEDEVRAQN
jgi:hypothetical protein